MKKNFMFTVVLSFALISLSQTSRAGDCQDRTSAGNYAAPKSIVPNDGLDENGQPIVGSGKNVNGTTQTGANT